MKVIREAKLEGAGLDFVLSNAEDESAPYQAYLTDLSGYYGGVSVDSTDTKRLLGHGNFALPSLRTGREMTLKGTLTFDTENLRTVADRFLSGLLWDGEFGTLTVTTDDLTLASTVKLGGEIKPEYLGRNALQVEIPLTAPDPFLYAPTRMYQIFPAGFGEGLVYPLFTTKTPDAANIAKPTTDSTYTVGTNSDGDTVVTTSQVGGSFVVVSAAVTPGETYRITTKITADKAGSKYAARFNSYGGANTTYKYFDTQANTITPEVPTDGEYREASWVFTAPAGATSTSLSWFPNHRNGSVTDATQTMVVRIEKASSSVLDWGAGTPFSGAFYNGGNATAFPRFVVNGEFPAGFQIVSEGRTIEYPAPVVPESPVTIDMRDGSVMIDGVDNTYRLTHREWFDIPQKQAIQPRINALAPSNGWADVFVADTYI